MPTEYLAGPEEPDALSEQQQGQQSRLPTSQGEDHHTWKNHTCVYCGVRAPLTADKGGFKIDVEELQREIARTKKLVQSILGNIKKTNHVISIGDFDDSTTTRASTKGKKEEEKELASDKASHVVPATAELEHESHEAQTPHFAEEGVIIEPQTEVHSLRENSTKLEKDLRERQSKHEHERQNWKEKTAKQEADSQSLHHQLQGYSVKLQDAESSLEKLKDIVSKTKGGMKLKRGYLWSGS
ncbi:uncharacterized protein N7483_007503 [Penicillium malachiteum]|uniref:uncharacterized protein n=1 Tax=Penicillium malachiteum TaxID=1324776 RepID=UPI002549847D|nr:uncharacterized protein N7483_007503 [Penicillium malachiteum]KAJ5726146.1 hypothetical protein N7483_007503 [Penicillium malachiteum]